MMLLDYWATVTDDESHPNRADSVGEDLTATAEEVFYTHAPLVYNVARRVLGNEADAEDVTQEVLLQVVRKLDSFRGEGRLAAWLHRLTINAALLHRRKHARRRERQVDVSLDLFPIVGRPCRNPGANSCPAQRVLANEMNELIERAIAGLPEIYRDVYVLADVEELSNAEIGEILSLSVQAVKSRLHRARLMMREALATHF
ncbi:MAG TPA: sigma-70 family RNA polymerase sigma factor [Bryobacteraceae bacterium]|jgi:RNA polymerase sigma-70 factor (ECF subfamily)